MVLICLNNRFLALLFHRWSTTPNRYSWSRYKYGLIEYWLLWPVIFSNCCSLFANSLIAVYLFKWFYYLLSFIFKPIAPAYFQCRFCFKNSSGKAILLPRFDISLCKIPTGQLCLSVLEIKQLLLVQLLELPWNFLLNTRFSFMRSSMFLYLGNSPNLFVIAGCIWGNFFFD